MKDETTGGLDPVRSDLLWMQEGMSREQSKGKATGGASTGLIRSSWAQKMG